MSGLRHELELRYIRANRIHAAFIEVTHRCPCECLHCLIGGHRGDEMSLDEISDLIQQLRAEGAFELGVSGGEPFLRDDLPQILEAAHRERFFTSLLTTGLLVGRAEVELIRRLGVHDVELSLLGGSAETHDAVMQTPGAFARAVQAARWLREAGVDVRLKCTILRANWREVSAMRDLAREIGAHFSASTLVSPRLDGDPAPQRLALTEEQVAQLHPTLVDGGLLPDERYETGALLKCRAGITVAGVSPEGDVFPCILMRRRVGNVRERSLKRIWRDEPDPFLLSLRALQPTDVAECHSCALRSVCHRCPGVAWLETGRVEGRSPSACASARGTAAAKKGLGG
jgi:radical SAM protein with 4Fe4S-binding SPASM domain